MKAMKLLIFLLFIFFPASLFSQESTGSMDMEAYSIFAGYSFVLAVGVFFGYFIYRSSRIQNYIPKPVRVYPETEETDGIGAEILPAFNTLYYSVIALIIFQLLLLAVHIF